METKDIVTIMSAIFGISATGFFFLAMWLRNIGIDMQKIRLDLEARVPFEWIEKTFKPEITQDLRSIIDELKEIKGFLLKVTEYGYRIDYIEKNCRKQHEDIHK